MKRGSRKPADAYCMTRPEVAALLWSAKNDLRDWRAYYIFSLMYLLGLRVGEVIVLRYEHLGPLSGLGWPTVVWVPTEKKRQATGGRWRIDAQTGMPLLPVPVLSHHELVRAAFTPGSRPDRDSKSAWLFPSPQSRGKALAKRTALLKFEQAKTAAYLNAGYTPHTLRHTAASRLYEKANSTRTVAEFLRHDVGGRAGDGLATTNRYIHVSLEEWHKYRGALDIPLPLRPLVPRR